MLNKGHPQYTYSMILVPFQLIFCIMKTMQNLFSYGKPNDIKDLFEQRKCHFDSHFLRHTIKFQIPLVKSIRLSSSPIYAFPSVYNNFPYEFKEIMERSIFLEKLFCHYSNGFKNEKCKKRFCQFCDISSYYERIRSFYSTALTKSHDYYRYGLS